MPDAVHAFAIDADRVLKEIELHEPTRLEKTENEGPNLC